jgi:hypothetical protein
MTYLYSYQFYIDGTVLLTYSNGNLKLIRKTKNSGRIVARKKVGTISNVNHPGIYVGKEVYTNESFILHNHYRLFGSAGVSPMREYAAGQKVYWDNRVCINDRITVLQKGLGQALRREPYHWLTNNCQVTVNEACNNERKSEDVGQWVGRIAFGVIGFLFVRAIID